MYGPCHSRICRKIFFNFTVRYINNSLSTRQNLTRWGISTTSDCSYCMAPKTLLHVVACCQSYLQRFTWRHDSILNILASYLQNVNGSCLYVDIPGYKCPSTITGDCFRVQTYFCHFQINVYILWN